MFWLDTTILILIVLGAVLGAMSGFLWQVARIVCLALSLYIAILLNDGVANLFQENLLQGVDPRLGQVLAYAAVFLVVYILLFQVVYLLDRGIRAVHLEPVDRLLGSAVGALKVALALAALFLALITYPHQQTKDIIEKSTLAPLLAGGMDLALVVIPEEYKAELCNGLKELKELARARLDKNADKDQLAQP